MTRQSYLFHALLFLGTFLAYAGFAAAWSFHLMLIAIIAVTFLYQLRIGLWWAIAAGFLLNSFTVGGNGVWMLGFVASVLAVHYLLQTWFPARSLISAAVVAASGVMVFEIITRTVGQLLIGLGASWSVRAPVAIVVHMLWAIILVTVVIGIIRSRTMHLRNAYLIR